MSHQADVGYQPHFWKRARRHFPKKMQGTGYITNNGAIAATPEEKERALREGRGGQFTEMFTPDEEMATQWLRFYSTALQGLDPPRFALPDLQEVVEMVKAATERGLIDGKLATLEMLTGIKRAGADVIITYHAIEASRWLQEG